MTRRHQGRESVPHRPDQSGSAVTLGLEIPCPNCGLRPFTEFSFGGELRALESADFDDDFRRVWLPANAAGPQEERWFHSFGCRRWMTLRRDTVTNRIDGVT
ncbi:MAG: sarcosine oxidase subunit delta [Actinomycetota bacterium]